MIIQSGNDACVALAEHIAGSESTFAEVMNNHAQRLGMLDSHFTNSTGLPDEDHYTTPEDIAKAATLRSGVLYCTVGIKRNPLQQDQAA
ncbi:D-alanyl-D-alanine carboxypeptidase family protein [endosymbiont of Lamellibrachia barhami]|uniref:D-alanyl-D-alanine carboxypeptidase family protein n=1 Tax=endosymbiont of Lamellibrachia barhami TaxID=205975 RepID=UPI002484077F|nr:hypothetical protein [endosymbiont of Lamellibrachia barhami]